MSWEIVTVSFRTEKFFFCKVKKWLSLFHFSKKCFFSCSGRRWKSDFHFLLHMCLFRTKFVRSSPTKTKSKMQKCSVIKMMQGEIGARLSSDPAVINERRWTSSNIGRERDRPLRRPWGGCTSWWRRRKWSSFQRRLSLLRSLRADEKLIGKDLT